MDGTAAERTSLQPVQEFHAKRVENEEFDDAFSGQALNHRTMLFMGDRSVHSLDGAWGFLTDQYDAVMRRGWHSLGPVTPHERTMPWEFDFEHRSRMTVPSAWNLAEPELHHYEGTAWYFRRIDLTPGPDERVFLRIGAANYDCKVLLNRRFLGNHYGGSTPFFVELTGLLRGDDELLIAVNNSRSPTRVPMRNTDWFNYGGLYREVALVRTPRTILRDLFVRLGPQGDQILVDAAIDGPAIGEIEVAIPELGVVATLPVKDGRAAGAIVATPLRWSPADPKRYWVEVTAGADRVRDLVGFRTIAVVGEQILLNGAPIALLGISVHEDDAALGKATSEQDIRRRFQHVKDLGGTFVRLAHYPHHERAAEIADELGLLLWCEVPVYWAIAFGDPAAYADADNQLRELILRDRNRASIVLWSVGNENVDDDARLDFMRRLVATARALDASRLITAACLVNHDSLRIDDRLAEHLDVIGMNEYYGWYSPHYDHLEEILANAPRGKPIIVSEFGADALAGLEAPADQPFSEPFQANVYRRQLAILDRFPQVVGLSPWILYDFRSPRRQNRYQRGWNLKGLIAADKTTKKQAFFVLQAYYRDRSRRT